MQKLDFIDKWPSPTWIRILLCVDGILAIIFWFWMNHFSDKTDYPGDIIKSQFTFNGARLRLDFAVLIDQGTIGYYRTTQCLDYFFLVFFFGLFFILALYLTRKHKDEFRRRFGLVTAFFFLAGGIMDTIENTFLLRMLSEPSGFHNWLAIAYSGFASLKWVFLCIGLILLIYTTIGLFVKKRRKSRSNHGDLSE